VINKNIADAHARRFLVVDDDEDFINDLVELIRKMGHVVVGKAQDGAQAMEVFSRDMENIDIVLMDIMMPQKNGIAAAGDIRRIAPSMKIILMSGNTKNEGLVSELKGVGFLKKPFNSEAILAHLDL
jgi:two-component system chemotaxis response regulator CheY